MILLFVLDVAANELINDKGEYSVQSKILYQLMNVINYYKKLNIRLSN